MASAPSAAACCWPSLCSAASGSSASCLRASSSWPPSGVVVPSGAAIALEGHPSSAGSAAALLGLAQYAIGAISASLVGVAGKGTALPMAIVIVICGLGAVAAFGLLVRPQAAGGYTFA